MRLEITKETVISCIKQIIIMYMPRVLNRTHVLQIRYLLDRFKTKKDLSSKEVKSHSFPNRIFYQLHKLTPHKSFFTLLGLKWKQRILKCLLMCLKIIMNFDVLFLEVGNIIPLCLEYKCEMAIPSTTTATGCLQC